MPLLADSSVPGSTWNVLSPGFHASTTPVLLLRERILEGLAGKNQHGRDERAVGECSDAVERHVVRRHDAADPGSRGCGAARVELEYLHRLAAAVVRRVDGVAAVARCAQAQAMQHRLFGIERTGTARVFRLVGARVRGAGRRTGSAPSSPGCPRCEGRCRAPCRWPPSSDCSGRRTRSSAFWTPQTKLSPPDGAHPDAGACAAATENEP